MEFYRSYYENEHIKTSSTEPSSQNFSHDITSRATFTPEQGSNTQNSTSDIGVNIIPTTGRSLTSDDASSLQQQHEQQHHLQHHNTGLQYREVQQQNDEYSHQQRYAQVPQGYHGGSYLSCSTQTHLVVSHQQRQQMFDNYNNTQVAQSNMNAPLQQPYWNQNQCPHPSADFTVHTQQTPQVLSGDRQPENTLTCSGVNHHQPNMNAPLQRPYGNQHQYPHPKANVTVFTQQVPVPHAVPGDQQPENTPLAQPGRNGGSNNEQAHTQGENITLSSIIKNARMGSPLFSCYTDTVTEDKTEETSDLFRDKSSDLSVYCAEHILSTNQHVPPLVSTDGGATSSFQPNTRSLPTDLTITFSNNDTREGRHTDSQDLPMSQEPLVDESQKSYQQDGTPLLPSSPNNTTDDVHVDVSESRARPRDRSRDRSRSRSPYRRERRSTRHAESCPEQCPSSPGSRNFPIDRLKRSRKPSSEGRHVPVKRDTDREAKLGLNRTRNRSRSRSKNRSSSRTIEGQGCSYYRRSSGETTGRYAYIPKPSGIRRRHFDRSQHYRRANDRLDRRRLPAFLSNSDMNEKHSSVSSGRTNRNINRIKYDDTRSERKARDLPKTRIRSPSLPKDRFGSRFSPHRRSRSRTSCGRSYRSHSRSTEREGSICRENESRRMTQSPSECTSLSSDAKIQINQIDGAANTYADIGYTQAEVGIPQEYEEGEIIEEITPQMKKRSIYINRDMILQMTSCL